MADSKRVYLTTIGFKRLESQVVALNVNRAEVECTISNHNIWPTLVNTVQRRTTAAADDMANLVYHTSTVVVVMSGYDNIHPVCLTQWLDMVPDTHIIAVCACRPAGRME